MRKISICISFLIASLFAHAQVVTEVPVSPATEQQLENITENSEDAETEDDSYLQELVQFLRNPVNINRADEQQLSELRILSPIQIQNFLRYRSRLGKLISLYELQAIPTWNIPLIQRLKPYITIGNDVNLKQTLATRFTEGDQSILIRVSQTLEKQRGFTLDSTQATNYYPGSQQRLLFRYKYTYKNLLQFGLVGEKDPGEEFFKGSQKSGFDYYSAHLFIRQLGMIKAIALGDYTVNMGQGLTQWQSLAFKKGPDVLATKRQSSVLRPYNSAGEILFHRGAGITVGNDKWEATAFGSVRNLDANFVQGDTLLTIEDQVTSLQTSGFHRTASELADKGTQRQISYGGNFSYRTGSLKVGFNAIHFDFELPINKSTLPYNKYAISGKQLGNYSIDYGYTNKNFHFFGEAAVSEKRYPAFISGLLISTASNIDMSFLYRNISKGYQSLYTNAFTESTYPTNERGLFSGISIKSFPGFQIDAYVDMYRFPYLKFRVNAPTTASDYFVQLSYRPNKVFDMYTRYKRESKAINYNPDDITLSPVIPQPRKNWRTQVSYKITSEITLRNRVEMVWYDKGNRAEEEGILLFADVLYKPMMKKYSGNFRLQYFQTDGYNSRLYAFENDVLYSFSIPVFYEKGYRYYMNINYDFSKKLTAWARIAQTFMPLRSSLGSGLDLIQGNRRTEVKLQVLYKF